jgi:predicted lipoprotein with Yx(FWY)xxD motif
MQFTPAEKEILMRAAAQRTKASLRPARPGGGRHARTAQAGGAAGLAAFAVAVLLAACGASSGGTSSGAGQPTGQQPQGGNGPVVSTRQLSSLGNVLVNSAGLTVYSPEQEANGTIKCTGACLSFWFPVTVSSPGQAHAAGITGTLGTIRRPDDGKTQLTYNGRPLYTFKLDSSPGQASGNGFKDQFGGTSFTWQAVSASGNPAPAQGSPTGGSPGY